MNERYEEMVKNVNRIAEDFKRSFAEYVDKENALERWFDGEDDYKNAIKELISIILDGKSLEKYEPQKMSHGTCCCCSDCGRYHDDCVCIHNENVDKIKEVLNKYGIEIAEVELPK